MGKQGCYFQVGCVPETGSVYVEEAKWPNRYSSLAPKDSHTDMVATLGNNAPPYAMVKRLSL